MLFVREHSFAIRPPRRRFFFFARFLACACSVLGLCAQQQEVELTGQRAIHDGQSTDWLSLVFMAFTSQKGPFTETGNAKGTAFGTIVIAVCFAAFWLPFCDSPSAVLFRLPSLHASRFTVCPVLSPSLFCPFFRTCVPVSVLASLSPPSRLSSRPRREWASMTNMPVLIEPNR